MNSEVEKYLSITYGIYLDQKISQILSKDPSSIGTALHQLDSQIFCIFQNKVTREQFLKVSIQWLTKFYQKDLNIQKYKNLTSLVLCNSKITFLLNLQRLNFQLADIIGQAKLAQYSTKYNEIKQLITEIQIISQFQYIGSFRSILTNILQSIISIPCVRLFIQQIKTLMKQLDIQYLQIDVLLQQVFQQAQQTKIQSQLETSKSNQSEKGNNKSIIQEKSIKFQEISQIKSHSSSFMMKSKEKDSVNSARYWNKKRQQATGRTIYISHPTKYLRKDKQRVHKRYNYVENQVIDSNY